MKTSELWQQRNRLVEMRDRLSGEVSTLIDAVVTDALPTGEHDRGVSESVDKDTALTNSEQRLRQEVIDALGRIDAGTYGVCQRCGREIEETRLDAVPQTPFCLECEHTSELASAP